MREIKFRAWDGNKMLKYAYIHDTPEGWLWLHNPVTVGVKSVMQYTGLKDKNGKEIYEGDIMKSGKIDEKDPKNLRVFVIWNERFARFELEDNQKDGEYSLMYQYWEVIGNIYENPELLKTND